MLYLVPNALQTIRRTSNEQRAIQNDLVDVGLSVHCHPAPRFQL